MNFEGAAAFLTVIIALVSVLVSVFTLNKSAKQEAFAQLQQVVTNLQTQLETANKTIETLGRKLDDERTKNERLEDERDKLILRIDAQDSLIKSLREEIDRLKKGMRAK